MTHDTSSDRRDYKWLKALNVFSSLYERVDTLTVSAGYKESGFQLLPSFLSYMEIIEEYEWVERVEGKNGKEAMWHITPRGRSVLSKFSDLQKEAISSLK